MLLLLCTAGVEIMRHSSVAARAPQQTHTVCIRYLRFSKGSGERCTQPDANFDRGETETISWVDTCVAGVVFTRVPVLSGDTASSLGPVWLSRGGHCQGFGRSGQRRVMGVWRDYNESCQLECILVAIFSAHEKKKSDLWPAHSPNTWVTGNYLAALFSMLSPDPWLGTMKWAA